LPASYVSRFVLVENGALPPVSGLYIVYLATGWFGLGTMI
jgi:hypothetical protein